MLACSLTHCYETEIFVGSDLTLINYLETHKIHAQGKNFKENEKEKMEKKQKRTA